MAFFLSLFSFLLNIICLLKTYMGKVNRLFGNIFAYITPWLGHFFWVLVSLCLGISIFLSSTCQPQRLSDSYYHNRTFISGPVHLLPPVSFAASLPIECFQAGEDWT